MFARAPCALVAFVRFTPQWSEDLNDSIKSRAWKRTRLYECNGGLEDFSASRDRAAYYSY
jgi:hypothetical protein